MESFLYNNPEIIGILSDSSGMKEDSAIIQQFPTQKGVGGKGRIDLIALNSDENSNLILKTKNEMYFPLFSYLLFFS